MHSRMEWGNGVYNSKFTNMREIRNTVVIKGNRSNERNNCYETICNSNQKKDNSNLMNAFNINYRILNNTLGKLSWRIQLTV